MSSLSSKLSLLLTTDPLTDLVDAQADLADNFTKLDLHIGSKVCTSATRPDNGANGPRFTGMWIFETDTKAYGIWDGAVWKIFDTQWQTYTTTWDATTGVTPVVNDGTLSAKSFRQGKKRTFSIALVFGNTTVKGTGTYTFTLPSVPVDKGRIGGDGFLTDVSAGDRFPITGYWIGANLLTMVYNITNTSGAGAAINTTGLSATAPIGIGNTDTISISGNYEEV